MKTMNSALLIIDMQQHFFTENPAVDSMQLARNCTAAATICRDVGIPVVHIMTLYREDKTDMPATYQQDGSWCCNLIAGRESAQLVPGISIDTRDHVVEKKRFSIRHNLDDILRSLGCTHLYLAGYSTDVCLRFTAVDAYNRGYHISLLNDCIEAFREPKDAATTYLNWLIPAQTTTLKDLEQQLANDTTRRFRAGQRNAINDG